MAKKDSKEDPLLVIVKRGSSLYAIDENQELSICLSDDKTVIKARLKIEIQLKVIPI